MSSVAGKRFCAGYWDQGINRHFWIAYTEDGVQRKVGYFSVRLNLNPKVLRNRILAALQQRFDIDHLDDPPNSGKSRTKKDEVRTEPMTIKDIDKEVREVFCKPWGAEQWAGSCLRQRAVTDDGEAYKKYLICGCNIVWR